MFIFLFLFTSSCVCFHVNLTSINAFMSDSIEFEEVLSWFYSVALFENVYEQRGKAEGGRKEGVEGSGKEQLNDGQASLCKKASNHHANLPLEMYSFTM